MIESRDVLTITTLEKGIVQVSLNQPGTLNALNKKALNQLSEIFSEINDDSSIKAVLLSGEGKAFCAGANIKELNALTGPKALAFAKFGQAVMNQIASLSKPTLAAIQGYALGGGLELAMAATIRIASSKTQFSQPEIKLGVIPGFGGTQRLSRLIGKGRALHLCLTGQRFTSEDALKWGLISEVTSEESLIERAHAMLKEIIQLPPIAMNSVMSVIEQGYDLSLDAALDLEAAYFALCCETVDKKEGVNAFLEKRSASFSGS